MVKTKHIMKNTELRIGNLVECFGIREVVAIKKDKIKVQNESEKGHFILEWTPITSLSLKPIPLNEEWLSKFNWNGYNPLHFNSNFEIDKQGRLYCNSDYKGVNVNYVHQLQNLYFALTGKELTLKNEL